MKGQIMDSHQFLDARLAKLVQASLWLEMSNSGLIIEITGLEIVVSSRKLPVVYDSLSRNSIISDHCGDLPIEDPSLESFLATILYGLILLTLPSIGVITWVDETE